MSRQRYINTKFWDDDFIVGLDPIEKLLYLYLLTNPSTSIAGVYEISVRRIAFDTGIDGEMVLKMLARFEAAGKVFYRDGWILILNFIKNQSANPRIRDGIIATVKCSPDWVKDRLSVTYTYLSKYLNSNSNSNPNSKPKGKQSETSSDVTAVFEHWQTVHGKQRSDLNQDRQTRIRKWLKKYTADQLKKAIDGAAKDDWLMGRSAKSTKKYNGLSTILRDSDQIDRLIDLADARTTNVTIISTVPVVKVDEPITGGVLTGRANDLPALRIAKRDN